MSSRESEFYNACREGNLPKVKEIVQQLDLGSANSKYVNRSGLSIALVYCEKGLLIACQEAQKEVVQFLLSIPQVDVNKPNEHGWTPLWISCKEGNEEIVRLLVEDQRIYVNKASNDGRTPLWVACENGMEEVVKNLLAGGKDVDVNRKGKNGNAGKEYSPAEIASLLEEYSLNKKETIARLRGELDLPPLSETPAQSPRTSAVFSDGFQFSLQDNENDWLRKELAKAKEEMERIAEELSQAKLEIQEKNQRIQQLEKNLRESNKDHDEEVAKRKEIESRLRAQSPPSQQQAIWQGKWWNLRSRSALTTWENKGSAGSQYFLVKVIENSQTLISEEDETLKKLRFLLARFGMNLSSLKRAQAVSSPLLTQNFENNLIQINTQKRNYPDKFPRNDWMLGSNQSEILQRFKFWYNLHQNRGMYDFDAAHMYEVLPMLHGCDENSAKSICESGFSSEPGFFGQGMYFTSSLKHGLNTAKKNTQGFYTFTICLVAPGNPYPAIEQPYRVVAGHRMELPDSLVGKPCKPGYQSHFTIVDRTAFPNSFPIKGDIDPNKAADELVVFYPQQVLPLFIVSI